MYEVTYLLPPSLYTSQPSLYNTPFLYSPLHNADTSLLPGALRTLRPDVHTVDTPPAQPTGGTRTWFVTSTAEGMPTRHGEAPSEGRTTRSVDDSEAGVRAKPVVCNLAYM